MFLIMKILFILDQPYPNGMACTKRIHLYAKGLMELGNKVKIIIPKPTERYDYVKNKKIKGTVEGVDFAYASNSTVRSKNFFIKRIQDFLALFKTFFYSIGFRPQHIILSSNSYFKIIFTKFILLFIFAKLIKEKSEVPFHSKNKISCLDNILLRLVYSLFDAIIVISRNLFDYFKKELELKSKIIEIPIITKNTNLSIENDIKKSNNFVYTGSLNDHKDGIINILKTFAKLADKYPNISLIMTGNLSSTPDRQKIKNIINKYKIEDRVIFPGYVSEEELNRIKSSAIALLLAKPYNRQNKYNMATKIAEYLQTGRPVILSCVDPATRYLKHRQSAFIVKPEVNDIAEEMKFVLNNPELSSQVGKNGKNIATKYFNYRIQAKNLNKFLLQL